MSVYLYNKIDIENISFNDNVYKKVRKFNGKQMIVHYIDMNYLGNSLYIQLSKSSLNNIDINKRKIEININKNINKFIKNFENYVIKTVYERSKNWFNGKKFTINKISNCIVSNIIEEPCQTDVKLGLTLSSDTKLYDEYKNEILLDSLEKEFQSGVNYTDMICIIKFANLQFIQNRFTYNLILEKAKIFKQDKLLTYSIMDDDEDVNTSNSEFEDEYYSDDCFDQNFF